MRSRILEVRDTVFNSAGDKSAEVPETMLVELEESLQLFVSSSPGIGGWALWNVCGNFHGDVRKSDWPVSTL